MHFLWQVNVISIHLLSKTSPVNKPVDVFCSRVCKKRIKHNRITPTGLGRIDTHTQMHRHTHPTPEKVAIVARMPHLIFWFPYSGQPVSQIPQDRKCS